MHFGNETILFFYITDIFKKIKDDIKDLNELVDLQSKAKQVRWVEKLGKQGFHDYIKEIFEPITKALTDSNQKILEEIKSITKAIEKPDGSNVHVKSLALMNKNGVVQSSLIRPIDKILIPTNKFQFRLQDDLDSDKWNDYVMNGGKVTKNDGKLVCENSGDFSTLRGDVLKNVTECKINISDSPDAKLIIDNSDEIHFDIHSRVKSLREKT